MPEKYLEKCILLQKEEPGWLRTLHQEGLLYITKNLDETIPDNVNLIILNDILEHKDLFHIRNFLSNGKCVISTFQNIDRVDSKSKLVKQKIRFISSNEVSGIFEGVETIDVFKPGYSCNNARYGLINNVYPAIYKEPLGKAYLVGLPFDVNQAILDQRQQKKQIAKHAGKPIFEKVSLVSKAGIIKLLINLMRKLYFDTNLPYTHLWYYPKNYKSVFAFRVDLDGYDKESFEITRSLAKKHQLSLSWFIDVKGHEKVLNVLKELKAEGQDVQIHCYFHRTFNSYFGNYFNIKMAQRFFKKEGIHPLGFVAPFGTWNFGLNKALEKLGFQYSSEFGLSYDGFPFYPSLDRKKTSRVLQIPIHPVCIGIMLESNMTAKEMVTYFKKTIDNKILKREPIFLYGHPMRRIAKFPEVIDFVFDYIKKKEQIWLTNFTEFNSWWRQRQQVFNIIINGHSLNRLNSNYIHTLRTLHPDSRETFTEIHP
ncbi:MAG: DUF2334 domain-containing protein [Candidatus Hodarchaeota archaeon]